MSGADGGVNDEILKIGQVFGRYRVERVLGRGGMGCVYEAIHVDLKKRVAIKVLFPSLASNVESRTRFVREGEAAARVRHPHVVDVDDVGTIDGICYLVMEYLEGEDLSKRLQREGRFSPALTADIMLPVVAAVAAAHQENVVHRDLKPENIFVGRGYQGGVHPKVLDFGISKLVNQQESLNLTGTQGMFGTPYYMAPEQLQGARFADARSDQYSIGAILYECVTGRRTHQGESMYTVLRSVAEGSFPRPRELQPDLPDPFERMVLRALAKEPAERFPDLVALGTELIGFAGEEMRTVWRGLFGTTAAISAGRRPAGHLRADTPSPSDQVRAGDTQLLEPAATTLQSSAGQLDQATFPVAPRGSRLPVGVGAAVVVVGVVAGVLVWMRPAPGPGIVPAARIVPALVRPARATFEVSIRTVPVEAKITVDGAFKGQGTVTMTLQRDDAPHALTVTAEGYRARTLEFRNEAPPSPIVLEKDQAPAANPPAFEVTPPAKHAPAAGPGRRHQAGTRTRHSDSVGAARPERANPNQNASPIVE
jgi:serine/threonine-protein kinase